MSEEKKKTRETEDDDIDESKKILSVDCVDVFGTSYDIILMEGMISEDGQIGGLDLQNGTILIDMDLDRIQSICETIVHELVHAYGIKFGDIKEKQVDMITSGIFGFIAHNPIMAKDLIRLAENKTKKE